MTAPYVKTLTKRTGWVRAYDFSFEDFAEFTKEKPESISSVVVTALLGTGLSIGATAFNGSIVQVILSGGTVGVTYLLLCTVTTIEGSTLSQEGILSVITN